MTRKKYGIMPPNPNLVAKVRGDAGVYDVWAIDWNHHKVQIYRALSYEWLPIDKVALSEREEEQENKPI